MDGGGGGGGTGSMEEAAVRPTTAEEEAAKRNTDCVYFLASPLTCKKGNECEYRHSEGARVNHRDCWYWLNGNCLNPRCSFRHPPLDGLLGVSGMTSVSAPSSQTAVTTQYPVVHGPYNPNKQGVVCYFFQKGQCLKGDKCSFVHGPQPSGPVPQKVGKVSVSATEPPQPLKESWPPKAFAQQNMPRASVEKQAEVPPFSAKPVTKDDTLTSNGFAHKRSLSPYNLENMLPRTQRIDVPASSVIDMPQSHLAEPLDEYPQNGREADEFLAESSPGFDVLADDVTDATGYVHGDDDFGRESLQGGMNLYPVSDFDYHHSEFEPVTDFHREQYNGIDEYDQYGHLSNHYGRDQRRSSSERILERQMSHEKRARQRESPEDVDTLDLRHQLMKHRRLNGPTSAVSLNRRCEPYRRDDDDGLNGLRSIVSHDRHGEAYRRDDHRRLYGSRSAVSPRRRNEPYRRDDHRRFNGSRSTASPERRGELYRRSDRSAEVEMYRGRRSHEDRQLHLSDSSLGSRLQGRIKLPSTSSPDRQLDPRSEREWDSTRHRGRLSPDRSINYPLRNGRIRQRSHEDFAAVNRNFRDQSFREDIADPLDFAGPKSLAELRGEKISAKSQGHSVKSSIIARLSPESRGTESGDPVDNHGSAVSLSRNDTVPILPESKAGASEESQAGGSMARTIAEMEETMITGTVGNKDLGNSDQRNKEPDYETIEDGGAKVEDDEHLYHEEEEMDDEDEDEDDFARKVGFIFS